jgi:hypothetical protein
MGYEEAMAVIRSGKNGSQILDLLDKIATLSTDDSDDDIGDSVEFSAE